MYLIIEGSANVRYSKTREAQHHTISTIGRRNGGSSFIHSFLSGKFRYFGELSFLTGKPRTATIVAKEPLRVLFISRNDYLNAVRESAVDYERACMLKDLIVDSRDMKMSGTECYLCDSASHIASDCHLAHVARLPLKDEGS